VGAEAVIDFTLQPGGVAEAVTVKADVPIVETTTSQTGGTLQREQLASFRRSRVISVPS
jgi:hypothetical protein